MFRPTEDTSDFYSTPKFKKTDENKVLTMDEFKKLVEQDPNTKERQKLMREGLKKNGGKIKKMNERVVLTNKETELSNDLKLVNTQITKLMLEKKEKQKELDSVKQELSKTAMKSLSVTDHAVLRYLERVEGIDVESIRKQVLSPEVVYAAEMSNGKCKVTVNGMRLTIVNNTVVTIIKD